MKPNRAIIAVSLAVAGLALAACGATPAGSAAVVGDERISEATLATEVAAVVQAQGKPADETSPELASTVLDRMVKQVLVDLLATEAGIEVTQGQIETQLQGYDQQVGGRTNVEVIFLDSGVAPSQIDGVVKLNLQAEALGQALAPSGSPEEQSMALVEALGALSAALETEVSPRFGSWDAANLSVGAVPDDLSVPAGE